MKKELTRKMKSVIKIIILLPVFIFIVSCVKHEVKGGAASATAILRSDEPVETRESTMVEIPKRSTVARDILKIILDYAPDPKIPYAAKTYKVLSMENNGVFNLQDGIKIKMAGITCGSAGKEIIMKLFSTKDQFIAFIPENEKNDANIIDAFIWQVDMSLMNNPKFKKTILVPSFSPLNDAVILNSWCEIDHNYSSKYSSRYNALEQIVKNRYVGKGDDATIHFDPSAYFDQTYNSKYFKFYFQGNNNKISTIPLFSDAFVDLIKTEYFKVDVRSTVNFYILKDKKEYEKFLTDQIKFPSVDWGVYLREINTFVTYETSGLGTFGHFIWDSLVKDNFNYSPYWAKTGIATLFEKIYGYKENEKLVLTYGFHNPWRIVRLNKQGKISNITLEEILFSRPFQNTSQSKKRLLMIFIYEQGKLEKYLDLIRKNSKNGYNTFLEAAFEERVDSLEKKWKNYLLNIELNIETVVQIPPSQIFNTKKLFETRVGKFSKKLTLEELKANLKSININSKHRGGRTRLHKAIIFRNIQLANSLIDLGADIHARSDSGITPLHEAALHNSVELVNLLLDKGADIHAKTKDGSSPFHLAVNGFKNSTETVRLLLAKGSDIHAKDNNGYTPLHLASGGGSVELVNLLLEKGADIHAKTNSGFTTLHMVHRAEVFKLLLEKGADIHAKNRFALTPLHMAASSGDVEVANLLLEKGADINAKGISGFTPLHWAVSRGKIKVLRLLLEKGVDFNQKNNNGKTALDMALEKGYIEIIEILKKAGGKTVV